MTDRQATFRQGLAIHARLEQAEKAASARLRAIPGVGSGRMGLTPDHVRASAEFKQAKAAHVQAAAQLAQFNGRFCKLFATELREERDRRRHERFDGARVNGETGKAEIWL